MSDKPVVGFIGLGMMGRGIARNIRKAGYELKVSDPFNHEAVANLVSLGATEVASPKDMAAVCDVVHLCLPNSKLVEEVVRGESGILAGARPGFVLVDTSTADPGSTAVLSEELKAKGAVMVDAALGRTPKEAEEGTLDAMVGGDEVAFATVRPIIECWAGAITHVGPVGSGHKMKLLMNFIGMSYGALYSEAVVLAAKIGISPQMMREVIGPSRMGNGWFDTFMRYVVDRDRDAHKFTIGFALKDLRYVGRMADDAGILSVMAAAAKQYYTHAEAIGRSGDFVPMLSDHVGALNGVDMAEMVRQGGRPAGEPGR